MPPVGWNEHRLAGILYALNPVRNLPRTLWAFRFFEAGKDKIEVLDGLVVFTFLHQVLTANKVLVDVRMRRDQQPPLVPLNTCIPS